MATMALSITGMAVLLAAPAHQRAGGAARGSHWLAAYGVVAGARRELRRRSRLRWRSRCSARSGPKRTRLVAQIVAAVIGAAFVIGVQIAAILSADTKLTSTLVALCAAQIGHSS